MSTTIVPGSEVAATPGRLPRRWRQVAVPTEHGGWSLTAEPVLLGLLVAWSWSGLAIGAAAMLAFVARTPLKLVLVDRWRHRWLDRSRLAARVAAVELALIAVLAVCAAIGTARGTFWVPFAIAGPLVGLELWFDMRSRSRRLVPELAGTVGIGAAATAIALAGGADTAVAFGLWVAVSARAAAAIPYVRTQIARAHDRPFARWHGDVAQVAAVAAVAAAWAVDALPFAVVVAVAVVAAFNVLALRRAPSRAVVIGAQQAVFGLLVLGVTAASVLVWTS
jgi:hypothetical protein